MDSVALWFAAADAENETRNEINNRVNLRTIRNSSNVFSLSDKSFVHNFRLSKDAFKYVLNSIAPELSAAQKSTAIPPIIKLAAALKILGQGAYQRQIGQDRHVGLSQQSMSRCFLEVCKAIEKTLCSKHINFEMSESKKTNAKRYFLRKCGIPGIIGAVDGSHIQMIRPKLNEHLYYNRKLKHSINAMVICDHLLKVRAVDPRYGGACHDSHIWNLSSERRMLKEHFENGESGTWILGDSGYPLEPWILTPYRNANENSPESHFNDCHAKGRAIIERLFGVLKGRFRCLLAARELHYEPPKVARILNVCCTLHNICIEFNAELPPLEVAESEFAQTNFSSPNEENNSLSIISRNIRVEIKNKLIL